MDVKQTEPNDRWSGEVQCPEGTKVTGGGFEVPDNSEDTIVKNKPIKNGWEVEVIQKTTSLTFLSVHAQCGKLVSSNH